MWKDSIFGLFQGQGELILPLIGAKEAPPGPKTIPLDNQKIIM